MHIDNSAELSSIREYKDKYVYRSLPDNIKEAYKREMLLRLSWNTNNIEGSTLSLNETIEVIEYDEVRSGHTYSEYSEAKSAYKANHDLLNFDEHVMIDLTFIQKANSIIMNGSGEFRTVNVYIGTLVEQAFLPPSPRDVPEMMNKYIKRLREDPEKSDPAETIHDAALLHMDFERIHPFIDGNGRTGRLFINQYLLNSGLMPVIIENNSRYRQAFRYYERNGDTSLMEHCLASGICRSYEILKDNIHLLDQTN